VYDFTAATAAQVTSRGTALQTIATALTANFTPAGIIYAPNIKSISDLSTLQNQQNQTNGWIHTNIFQDGNATGASLYVTSGISINAIGCELGASSAAAVSQCIGEVGAFNISNGTEMAVPAFANGQLVSAVASSLLDTLDAYRYGFAVNYPNFSGTYINNDWTCISQSSDYNRLCRVLVINKATVLSYKGVMPLLKSRLILNANGTLNTITINQFDTAVGSGVAQMQRDGDISAYSVVIDPTQNVLSTNKIIVTLKIVPVGIADTIQINLGYAVNV
jgi:hypothetical protein